MRRDGWTVTGHARFGARFGGRLVRARADPARIPTRDDDRSVACFAEANARRRVRCGDRRVI